jgi:hypothetical protein
MTPIEQAEKIVRDLEEEKESLLGRTTILQKQREQISYSARTGDKSARAKLNALNVEISTNASESEIVDAALREAITRSGAARQAAQQAEAIAANNERERKIRELQTALVERLEIANDACEDIVSATTEAKILFNELHKLGIKTPTDDQLRINSVLAIKTLLNALPWAREFQFEHPPSVLAPDQRKYFKALAESWGAAINRQIADRLPADQKEKAA